MTTTTPTADSGVLAELDSLATLFTNPDYRDYPDKVLSIRTRVAALVEAGELTKRALELDMHDVRDNNPDCKLCVAHGSLSKALDAVKS